VRTGIAGDLFAAQQFVLPIRASSASRAVEPFGMNPESVRLNAGNHSASTRLTQHEAWNLRLRGSPFRRRFHARKDFG